MSAPPLALWDPEASAWVSIMQHEPTEMERHNWFVDVYWPARESLLQWFIFKTPRPHVFFVSRCEVDQALELAGCQRGMFVLKRT